MTSREHVSNIGDRGARRRRASGVVWLIVAIALFVVLLLAGAPRWARLAVGIPVGLAAIGFLQARERT
ncbi:MAG TPA: hypothetical protein VL524_17120 [Gemmatimonadaceae bacterium]|nr:hypothetical protein [Gemmatimonadaceae bacterium]